MTQDQILILLFRIVLIGGVAASLLWGAVYTYLARWWADPIGATVMRLVIYLVALLIPSIISFFFSLNRYTSHIIGWFDLAIFTAVDLELLRRVLLWVRLHKGEGGQRSYADLLSFIAEVIRRRGRPLWKDPAKPHGRDDAS